MISHKCNLSNDSKIFETIKSIHDNLLLQTNNHFKKKKSYIYRIQCSSEWMATAYNMQMHWYSLHCSVLLAMTLYLHSRYSVGQMIANPWPSHHFPTESKRKLGSCSLKTQIDFCGDRENNNRKKRFEPFG
jgi:hypothetical protein